MPLMSSQDGCGGRECQGVLLSTFPRLAPCTAMRWSKLSLQDAEQAEEWRTHDIDFLENVRACALDLLSSRDNFARSRVDLRAGNVRESARFWQGLTASRCFCVFAA